MLWSAAFGIGDCGRSDAFPKTSRRFGFAFWNLVGSLVLCFLLFDMFYVVYIMFSLTTRPC